MVIKEFPSSIIYRKGTKGRVKTRKMGQGGGMMTPISNKKTNPK
jgi:hypothetical protein